MVLSTDQQNSGRRQAQRFSVSGGLQTNPANQETAGVSFLALKNCLVDKRLGGVLKRPGSTTETVTTGLGHALGCGEYTAPDVTLSIPIRRTLLVNFAGTFYQNQAGAWTSVSKTTNTQFDPYRQTQFAKLGTNLYIAGGLPAKWGGPGETIERMGIIAPTSEITVTSTAVAGSITLTSGRQYMYTYYNSDNGLESDWSPLSTTTGAITSKRIEIAIPAATATNWDKIRIYACLDGNLFPYLVTTVNAGTTTYTDNTTDASLTTRATDRYENAVPPSSCFIMAKYAQSLWMVDGTNQHKLWFSKPYTGSDVDLEYFPVDNYLVSNEPITGLAVVPGKMLVFHPRSISYVSGFSKDDFVFQPFMAGVGTVFANSIATNGKDVVFLAEEGYVSIGREPAHISREIDLDIHSFLSTSFNSSMYVSSCWNPVLRQFVIMLAGQSSAGAPWIDSLTGLTVTPAWEDSVSLADAAWEDSTNPSAIDNIRVKIWGWSPEISSGASNLWMEYSFAQFADTNGGGAYPIFLFHPQPSSDVGDPQQDKTFIGFVNPSGGGVVTGFRRDKSQDDSTAITSEILTGRICPGDQSGGYKLFHGMGFMNSYSDPTADGSGTISYVLDYDDPHLRSPTYVTVSDTTDLKRFTTGLGRHLHLRVVDTSTSLSKLLLSEFFIHFRERFRKEGR